MARTTVPLTDTICRLASLLIAPTDFSMAKVCTSWCRLQRRRFRCGQEGFTSLGSYPVTGLDAASAKQLELKQIRAKGIDAVESLSEQSIQPFASAIAGKGELRGFMACSFEPTLSHRFALGIETHTIRTVCMEVAE